MFGRGRASGGLRVSGVSAMRTYSYQRRLHWSECDPGGIVFFPHYTRWMVDGLNEMFLSLGIDPNAVNEAGERGGLPVLQLTMEFHKAPILNQTVTHEIHVEKVGGKSLAFRHRFLRGDELLMEAADTRIWATHSLDNPASISTLRVPDPVRAVLSSND
jgi:4-hydroxybenzoyl-CoA thioesterase